LNAPPAYTLDDAVRLCDPFTPLDPQSDTSLREDLNAIRGGDRLAKIERNIRRSGGIPTLHFLTGHIGSGKTTEMLRMRQRLLATSATARSNTVFYLDADAMLDRNDVDLEDIVVALWELVFRENAAAAASVLVPVWKEQIQNTLKTFIANLPDKVPDAVGTVLGQLRLPGLDQRQKVRVGVGSVLGALLNGLNQAFEGIRQEKTDSIVLLIDNLEKLSQGQREGVERLYLERMGALKQLEAHLVITVPLYLCYAAAGASLIGLYGGEVVVLPMIKVRKRVSEGSGDAEEGLAAMSDLLQKRVAFGDLFEGGETAARDIARLSGGCIRHALRIVQGAANEHDNPPVSAASVQRAAAAVQADFERALPEAWVPFLKAIAANNRFPENCPEDAKRNLLRHLFVLEYQNGEPDPWYAVHPLVEQCRKHREHGVK
jgi:hypothetical protein